MNRTIVTVTASGLLVSVLLFATHASDAGDVETASPEAVGRAHQGQVGGYITGLKPGFVVCRNLSTGASVTVLPDGQAGWNCSRAGLKVSKGDVVRVLIGGSAR